MATAEPAVAPSSPALARGDLFTGPMFIFTRAGSLFAPWLSVTWISNESWPDASAFEVYFTLPSYQILDQPCLWLVVLLL